MRLAFSSSVCQSLHQVILQTWPLSQFPCLDVTGCSPALDSAWCITFLPNGLETQYQSHFRSDKLTLCGFLLEKICH